MPSQLRPAVAITKLFKQNSFVLPTVYAAKISIDRSCVCAAPSHPPRSTLSRHHNWSGERCARHSTCVSLCVCGLVNVCLICRPLSPPPPPSPSLTRTQAAVHALPPSRNSTFAPIDEHRRFAGPQQKNVHTSLKKKA